MDIETPEAPESSPEPSLRESLEAAFDEEPAPAPAAAPADEPATPEPVEPEPTGPVRDEKGRFVPKPKPDVDDHGAASAKGGAQPVAGTPAPGTPIPAQEIVPAQEIAPAVEKAPQSWRPAAREVWSKLPAEARQEVLRREGEVARVLQESAGARKAAEAFHEAVRPYEAMIRAEGGDPVRTIGGLLQTAAALRTAPPAVRAQMVANIVKTFGIPIDALDAALVGEAPPPGAQQASYQDPRVDQLLAQLEAAQRQSEHRVFADSQREVEKFGGDKEFFQDVRSLMADLMEVSAKRGERLDLATAYDRAIALSPDIAKVVEQRKAAANAAKAQASTQRSRLAASSVRSTPSVAPRSGGEARSLREDLEQAIEAVDGR